MSCTPWGWMLSTFVGLPSLPTTCIPGLMSPIGIKPLGVSTGSLIGFALPVPMPEVCRAALVGSVAMRSMASACSGVGDILSNDVFPSVLFVFKASLVRRKSSKHPIFIIHTPKRALVLYRAPSAIRYCQRKQFRVKETFGIFLAGQLHVMLLLIKRCVVGAPILCWYCPVVQSVQSALSTPDPHVRQGSLLRHCFHHHRRKRGAILPAFLVRYGQAVNAPIGTSDLIHHSLTSNSISTPCGHSGVPCSSIHLIVARAMYPQQPLASNLRM